MSPYESGCSDSLTGDGGLSSSIDSLDATPHDGTQFPAAPNVPTQPNSLTSSRTSVLTRDRTDQSVLSTASSDRSIFEDTPNIDRIQTLMDSNRPTESLIERTRTLIDFFSQSNKTIPHWVTTYGIQRGAFKLDLLLTAMLDHAPSCAGPDLRMHGSYKKYSSSADPSGAAIPTQVETSGFMFKEPGSRPSTMLMQVMKRQDRICPITGVREEEHWDALAEDPDMLLSVMETCHIFDLDLDNPKDCFAMITWDIVRNYLTLNDEEMEALVATIDDPSNGIGFELVTHHQFDKFKFSLHATDHFRLLVPPTGGSQHRVVFKDYSNSDPSIPLPNPTYLRLHAAVAGILHMSGAAAVMDQFKEKYGEGSGGSGLLGKSGHKFKNLIRFLDLGSTMISARD
ncbi:hypothetical protein EDD85DRAFT_1016214 [Armillaria nabsnona]|nr:hypothetical protein EDD85DRAFT_1016214 [Armillaria nabsnona]